VFDRCPLSVIGFVGAFASSTSNGVSALFLWVLDGLFYLTCQRWDLARGRSPICSPENWGECIRYTK